MLVSWWNKLLPATGDPLLRSRAALIVATALGVLVVLLALILTWLISGDLQWQTVVMAVFFSGLMAGIVALARAGRIRWAAWLLIGVLMAATASAQVGYGLASPGAAGFFVPIVLAACVSGPGGGLIVAFASACVVWVIGIFAATGFYTPLIPYDISHLTFNAPLWTFLYFLIAAMVGFWGRMLSGYIERQNGRERKSTKKLDGE